jgi:hypothetical protein
VCVFESGECGGAGGFAEGGFLHGVGFDGESEFVAVFDEVGEDVAVAVDARNLRGREGELGVRGFGGGDVHEEGLAFWFGSVSERIENIKGVGWAIVFFLGV